MTRGRSQSGAPAAIAALAIVVLLVVAAIVTRAVDGEPDEQPATSSSVATTSDAQFAEVTPLEGRPADVVYAGGSIWVADDDRDVVLRLDPADGRQQGDPIPVIDRPVAIAAADDSVWVAGANGDAMRIDAATGNPDDAVRIGGTLVDVAVGDEHVWFADVERGFVRPLDLATSSVGPPLRAGDGAVRLELFDGVLWVTNRFDTVTPYAVDIGTSYTAVRVGSGPIGMAVVGRELWVANSDDGTITRIDSETRRVVGEPIDAGETPIAVAPDGEHVWVLDQDAGDALLLRRDGTLVRTVDIGTRPRGLVITPEGLWIAGVDPSAAVLVRSASR